MRFPISITACILDDDQSEIGLQGIDRSCPDTATGTETADDNRVNIQVVKYLP